jgi:hypothetical protein
MSTTAKQELIDLINHDNNTSLQASDVTISAPEVVDYQGRNTKVVVSANPDTQFSGSMNIYYNRLSLPALGTLDASSPVPLTVSDFLTLLSNQKKIDLLAEEFDDIVLPDIQIGEVVKIPIVAKSGAIKWYGQTVADYTLGFPPEYDIFDHFVNVTLPSYNLLG